MASYRQVTYCPTCKKNTTNVNNGTCKSCGTKLIKKSWSVRFKIYENNVEKYKSLNGYATKKEATQAYVDFMATYKSPKEKIQKLNAYNMPFYTLYEKYKEYYKNEIKETSYNKNTNEAERFIIPFFNNKIVGKINEHDIVSWKTFINNYTYQKQGNETPLAHKSKTTIFTILVHILNYAIKFWQLNYNVAIKVGNFKNHSELKKEMQFWTYQEFTQFISVADNNLYKAVFMTLYYTGMRKGELLALKWSDIDIDNKTININKTASRSSDSENFYKITTPKSKNSNRKITMPDILVNELSLLKESSNYNNFVFGGERVLPQQNILNYMNKWCEISKAKKIRIHDIRHSHVSLLISMGGNSLSLLYVIAKRIGDTPEQILETYGHLFPSDEKAAIERLNDYVNYSQ